MMTLKLYSVSSQTCKWTCLMKLMVLCSFKSWRVLYHQGQNWLMLVFNDMWSWRIIQELYNFIKRFFVGSFLILLDDSAFFFFPLSSPDKSVLSPLFHLSKSYIFFLVCVSHDCWLTSLLSTNLHFNAYYDPIKLSCLLLFSFRVVRIRRFREVNQEAVLLALCSKTFTQKVIIFRFHSSKHEENIQTS